MSFSSAADRARRSPGSRAAHRAGVPASGIVLAILFAVAGCSTVPPSVVTVARPQSQPGTSVPVPHLPAAGSGRGGYYQDDGPGDAPPADLLSTQDAQPRIEPYAVRGNKPYVVFGKTYTPLIEDKPFRQRGVGSWYGKKFHGQKTSSGELYDMYKMTAAHPTLPIPSYARVTNLKNGKQVIVRVNDRGPFHSSRIIDVSYTAALKLGYLGYGSSELEVERILPEEISRMINDARSAPAQPVLASTAPTAPVPPVMAQQEQSLDEYLRSQTPAAGRATTGAAALLVPVPLQTAPSAVLQPVLLMPADATADATSMAARFYLQFGAFAQNVNAQAVRERLMAAWPPSLPVLQVQYSDSVYRLYSGPFRNRSDAQQAAVLSENPVVTPMVVLRPF